jgi:glycosyltransferase 2 family protein
VTERLGPDALTNEEEAEARRDLRFLLRGALLLVVGGFVAFAIIHEVGRIPDASLRFKPGWLALAAVGFIALQVWCAELWRRLMALLREDLSVPRSQAIWHASNLARYVPTSLLAIVVRLRMSQHAGASRQHAGVSIVYELPLCLVGALCLGAWFVVQLPQLRDLQALRWLVVAVPIAAIVALHPRIFHFVADRLLRRFGGEPLTQALSSRRVVGFAALYAVGFLVAGLATYAFAAGIYEMQPSDLPSVIGAFSAGYAVSLFSFLLPGGLGAREAAFAAALAPVAPTSVAVAVAVGVRLLQMAVEVLLSLGAPLWARGYERRRNASVSANDSGVPIS